MNFIHSFFNIRGIFSLFMMVISCNYSAAEDNFSLGAEPVIQHFDLPAPIKKRNIRDIVFDDRGILYISVKNRLYIFNGNNWEYVSTKGISLIEKTDSAGVFVADNKNFGILTLDSSLNYQIQSRLNQLPEKYRNPAYINNLYSDDKYVYVHISDKIFFTEGKNFYEFSLPDQIDFKTLPPFYKRWWSYLIYLIILVTVFFILYKTYILKIHRISSKEEEENEIIPSAYPDEKPLTGPDTFVNTEKETKKEKRSRWDKYDMATVLFSDIQGFTKIAEQMNPEMLIDELDRFFFHFDSVVDKYNIEKIKTIGDAYMAAGGIPRKNSTNPIEVVLAALEMQHYMKMLKKTKVEIWDLRIGIHSGPIIAGIIGSKKRSYDIWGDTVNTASRMESSGEPGRVNISGSTYHLIKDYFLCEYRGKIPVKYKGNIDMYFVNGLRPELSVNLEGIPNRKFFTKLQFLRLTDLEEFVFEKLETELPSNLYFHNKDYARHLYEYSELLTRAEDLDLEESLLVKTATLLIPLGYIESYHNPESRVAQIASELLKDFSYNDRQINAIIKLILSGKLPSEPQTLTEKIMLDIRLEYLGRIDFIKLYKLLFLERNEYFPPKSAREWKKEQIYLLENYEFMTTGARKLREISSSEQIRLINEDDWL